MAYLYLAKYETYAKRISVSEKSQEKVEAAIRTSFDSIINQSQRMRIQCWSEDFQEYEDVADFSLLPDKCKLLICIDETQLEQQLPPAITEANSESNTSVQPVDVARDGFVAFPVVYKLPKFPPRVEAVLLSDAKQVMEEPSGSLRRAIIQALYDQCEQYEKRYLQGHHYDTVCRTLLRDHPGLADKVIKGGNNVRCNRSSYETWKDALITKFKTERHKIIASPEVSAMRQKYGHMKGQKRSRSLETSQDEQEPCRRNRTRVEVFVVEGGETEDTVQTHIESIKREWSKSNPDVALLKDRMDRTGAHRLTLYNGSTNTLLESYPLLRDCYQLIEDCSRLFKINFTEKRTSYLTDTRLDHLLQTAGRKVPQDEVHIATLQSSKDDKVKAVLAYAPLLFRESMDSWLNINKNIQGNDPTMVVSGNLMSEDASFKICLDSVVICGNAPTLPLAVDVLLSVIYLFNAQFPKRNKKTLRFLAEVVGGAPCQQPLPVSVQRVVNKIPSGESLSQELEDSDHECGCG